MTQDEVVKPEKSLIGKIFSMETLILLAGCFLLWYGFTDDTEGMGIFWGVTILIGYVLLKMVRKKDWAKHFAEMEEEQKIRAEYARKVAEAKKAEEK
ncbi:MAG TPA: hypothetical protein HPP76_06295 [Desulfuromonadales bacterium]|nr:hypothetical protein [Desulfuromonadales bacterium]